MHVAVVRDTTRFSRFAPDKPAIVPDIQASGFLLTKEAAVAHLHEREHWTNRVPMRLRKPLKKWFYRPPAPWVQRRFC